MIVTVAVYASGGAILANLLDIPRAWATVVAGGLATVYVSVGGMRSVVQTDVVRAVVMMTGMITVAVLGYHRVGGLHTLQSELSATMFSWHGVGFAQIFAWLIAAIGATFATQYVVQAITTVGDTGKAQRATVYAGVFLVPYGLVAAFIGMCSGGSTPGSRAFRRFPR